MNEETFDRDLRLRPGIDNRLAHFVAGVEQTGSIDSPLRIWFLLPFGLIIGSIVPTPLGEQYENAILGIPYEQTEEHQERREPHEVDEDEGKRELFVYLKDGRLEYPTVAPLPPLIRLRLSAVIGYGIGEIPRPRRRP
jgi:hypothetical protein